MLLAMVMVLSMSVIPAAARGNSEKSNTKSSSSKSSVSTSVTKSSTDSDTTSKTKAKTNDNSSNLKEQNKNQNKNQFKTELNIQKKELQQQKSSLNQQKEALETQYENLVATGDTTGAEAILEKINNLDEQITKLKEQIKETINERYMVVKTMYTDAELSQFDSAADLIAQMYADANVLEAGCVNINNNIIKFDTPAYIKGGVTLVPLRAITEALNGQVTWDGETQTVTITKDNTVVEITANSTTVLVDGEPVEINVPAEVTCSRTYLPLRFLAETLGFDVSWDGDNEIIDIDDEATADTTTVDSTETTEDTENTTEDTDSTNDSTTMDTSTESTINE